MSDDRSRERRRLAAESLALAKDTSDTDVRAFLLAMAQKWLDLAEQDEQCSFQLAPRLYTLPWSEVVALFRAGV